MKEIYCVHLMKFYVTHFNIVFAMKFQEMRSNSEKNNIFENIKIQPNF